eukprot:347241-Chlamydomonas_euryale.AAC.10
MTVTAAAYSPVALQHDGDRGSIQPGPTPAHRPVTRWLLKLEAGSHLWESSTPARRGSRCAI